MTAAQLVRTLREELPLELRHEAELIVEYATGFPREERLWWGERTVTSEAEEKARACLAERLLGKPLQYLFGYWWFLGRKLHVAPGVLIPRPETELLARLAAERAAELGGRRVLDLCCGTGCIGLTVALEADCPVTLADIEPRALALTGENAALWGVSSRVRITCRDALQKPELGSFGVIVSNPPYIPTGELPTLDRGVRDYEPALALDGGADGLRFYRALAGYAPQLLDAGGCLLLEVGLGQARQVAALLEKEFETVSIHRDLEGIERMVEGRMRG